MATFTPTRALVSVDLPVLGRPTRHAKPERCGGRGPRPAPCGAISASRWWRRPRRRPRRRGGARGSPRAAPVSSRASRSVRAALSCPPPSWSSALASTAVSRLPSTRSAVRTRPATRAVSPCAGTADSALASRPPTESTSSSSTSRPNSSPSSSTAIRGLTRKVPASTTTTSGSARSYSSAISPTISSRASSRVTSPATPPYSSTTMARCTDCCCISRSRESTRWVSGTNVAGRTRWPTPGGPGTGRRSETWRTRSLRNSTPRTSSTLSPTTGRRESPEVRNVRSATRGGGGRRQGDHVGARGHHLAHQGVAQLEDGVDHAALAGLDEVGLAGPVDHLAQLGLGGERPVAVALPRGQGVADRDQRARRGGPGCASGRTGRRPGAAPRRRRAGGPGCAGPRPGR